MKKAIGLFMLALAWTGAVCAQTTTPAVNSTAETITSEANLQDGFYVLKCKNGNNTNSGYAYYTTETDRHFRFSTSTQPTPTFTQGGSTINANELKYVWKLTKDTANGTFTLYNLQAGVYVPADANHGNDMKSTETANLKVSTYNAQGANPAALAKGVHIYQTNHKPQNQNLYWHGNAPTGDMNLNYWEGNGVNGTPVQVEFYKVNISYVEMTYSYKYNNQEKYNKKVFTEVGKDYPTLSFSMPFGIEAEPLTGKVQSSDNGQTKNITLKNTKIVEGQYYFLHLGNSGGFLHDALDAAQMDMGASQGKKKLADKSQLWKFVGNAWDGYKIVNAQSGGVLNANPTDAGNSGGNNPVTVNKNIAQGNIDTWIATTSTHTEYAPNGFFLNLKGHNNMRMNFRTPKLAFWTGGADYGSTINIETAIPAQRMATVNNESFASVYFPFAVKLPADTKAYVAASIANNNLRLVEVANGIVPEKTGVVLVKSPAATEVVLNLAAESTTTTALTNLFEGTLEAMASDGKLALGKSTAGEVGFYSVAQGIQIPANRAYLSTSKLNGQQALKLNFDGEATNIELVEGEGFRNNAPIFDMSGRRVMKTVKGGLYIQGGKKFIAQ